MPLFKRRRYWNRHYRQAMEEASRQGELSGIMDALPSMTDLPQGNFSMPCLQGAAGTICRRSMDATPPIPVEIDGGLPSS
jgi:hypothetical protein